MTAPIVAARRRSAWLEIDLAAIRHNVEVIERLVAPAAVAPVIKADAYGHGVAQVGPALAHHADALCVATLDEALALRARVPGRVLLLYPVPQVAAGDAVDAGIELTVMSSQDLRAVQAASRPGTAPLPIHVCVETGMSRGGVPAHEVGSVAADISADAGLVLAGLWSHLASPEDARSSGAQVRRFEAAGAALRSAGLALPARHIAASGGIFARDAAWFDLVRPGLAIYGLLDDDLPIAASASASAAQLRPAMSLKARAVAFSDVPEGGTVGYGDRWRAQRPSRIATLPVGYGDGYLRGTQPGAEVLVGGLRRPLVGVISMDAVAVDVTDSPGLDHGDEFVLLGGQGSERITAGELARRRNTIVWEVLSSMAQRVDRVYYPEAGSAHQD
jgi:alanine racemase